MKATEEARVFGAKGKEQPSWQDTNLALFGSDIEYKIKEAAAKGEPQWTGAGTAKGLLVWRIEQFKVVAWPKSRYGEFHVGDSFIVLNTYQPSPSSPALAWNIHFWIGSESTQDEYGTAAYKTVELDNFLGRKAVQYREVQDHESRRFQKLFPGGMKFLAGGVASGFRHVEAKDREAVLLRVKGRGNNVTLTQVEARRSAMNSGDVFILDCNEGIYQWNGAEANGYERSRAAEVCAAMREQRGNAQFICFEEGSPRTLDASLPFAKYLPVEDKSLGGASVGVQAASTASADADIKGFRKSIYELQLATDKPGEIGIVPLQSGKLPRELLKSDGVYLVDSGFHAYLWVGDSADFAKRVSAFVFAQAYLKRFQRPAVLPLTRFAEGEESDKFLQLFLKPVGYRIDANPEPERLHPLMRAAPKAKPQKAEAAFAPPSAGAPPMAVPMALPMATEVPMAVPMAEDLTVEPATKPTTTSASGKDETETLLGGDSSDDEHDDAPPKPRSEGIPWQQKLTCHNGVCYPVVSDAWGCCLTSMGCSWNDRIACLGLDVKGLYTVRAAARSRARLAFRLQVRP